MLFSSALLVIVIFDPVAHWLYSYIIVRFIDVKFIPKKKIKKLLMTLESFVLHYLITEGVKGMIVLFDRSI